MEVVNLSFVKSRTGCKCSIAQAIPHRFEDHDETFEHLYIGMEIYVREGYSIQITKIQDSQNYSLWHKRK